MQVPITDFTVRDQITSSKLCGLRVERQLRHAGSKRDRRRIDQLRFELQGRESFELGFGEIKAVLMQVGNVLQVRTEADNYQISPAGLSTTMWKYFIDRHLKHYRRQKGA